MLKLIELTGTPYEMGCRHGELLADGIRELSEIRLGLAQRFAAERGVSVTREDCVRLAKQHLPMHAEYSPECFAEWQGIAEGSGLPLEDVYFANALTDFQDVLARTGGGEIHECTSFIIGPDATADGVPYIGQTWDMHADAERFISVFHRRPNNGPASVTLTTAGCLSLIGVNEHGIAVGNNNLRPTDARPGVIYLAMLHTALRQSDWPAAVEAITQAPRASGHNYVMAHESGARSNIETTAESFHEFQIDEPWYVHSNHYLAPKLQPLEDPAIDRGSTEHRLQRLTERMSHASEPFSPDSLRQLLADHDGDEELCICRHGEEQAARSCAFVVVDPASKRLHAGLGPPCMTSLQQFQV